MLMWPLAASGGWPLARGYLHSDSVIAQRMRPYMPGVVGEGGIIRGGLLYMLEYMLIRQNTTHLSDHEFCILHAVLK